MGASIGKDKSGFYLYVCPHCKKKPVYSIHIRECGTDKTECPTCQGIGWITEGDKCNGD